MTTHRVAAFAKRKKAAKHVVKESTTSNVFKPICGTRVSGSGLYFLGMDYVTCKRCLKKLSNT